MIYFRCDGNSQIGGGHVFRCLSIACALQKENIPCCFIISDSEFEQIIVKKGFEVIKLNSSYFELENELNKLISIIVKDCSVLIVDSYFVTFNYLSTLKNNVKVVYIDDIFSFAYPVDVIINYNIFASKKRYQELYSNSGLSCPILLLGTKYVPLRDEFMVATPIEIRKNVKNIFVSTGSSDTYHTCLRLLDGIMFSEKNWNFHFLIGPKNDDYKIICEKATHHKNVFIYYNPNNISEIVKKCDVAFAASGSTVYELLSLGVPTITFSIADNQHDALESFNRHGYTVTVGDLRNKKLNFYEIEKICDNSLDFKSRIIMSKKAKKLVDCFGAFRIVSFLNKYYVLF